MIAYVQVDRNTWNSSFTFKRINEQLENWIEDLEKGRKCESRQIDILCMFLLGNNYSPAGFSINEIRIAKLWDESKE